MSGSLPQLQEQALERAGEFCARYVKPQRHNRFGAERAGVPYGSERSENPRRVCAGKGSGDDSPAKRPQSKPHSFYRPRDPGSSPFFKVVHEYFDEFERVYPERYQKAYGYWRPVIRTSIDKFVKCGDLKQGFARVRCPDCKAEYMVAFSCRQRGACPSCDQKRSLMLALRLNAEVFDAVPHRQWVFTIPKRLRVYFRYDRSLLGKLCSAAYETVCAVFAKDVDGGKGVPAMVAATQTFGDLMNFHPHVHSVVAEGVFTETGAFVAIPQL